MTTTTTSKNLDKSDEASPLISSNKSEMMTKTTEPDNGSQPNSVLDSDSGVERTSSSSVSNCSTEDNLERRGQDHQPTDCFEDASEAIAKCSEKRCASSSADHYKDEQTEEESDEAGSNEDSDDDVYYNLEPEENECQLEPAANKGFAGHQEHEIESCDLKVRLEETREILRMALSNEFVKALELCEERAKSELYAGLAHATLSFLRAALTLEQADLKAALESINQAFEVSQSKRRPVSTASMVMRFLYKPNYNSYSDDECHAELVNAEAMILLSLISFLADQSVLCLVRGAFRIRACYQRYKECLYIFANRTNWKSQEAKEHFESGVRMGHGIFNLLMSYLPRRVLKFLEYVGFSGSRSMGVSELDKSIALNDGLRSVFSALVILTYHSYVENLFGLGNYDEQKVEQLNNTFLGHYPDSAFFLLFLGRYYQMQGQPDKAIESFEKCCNVQQDWKQFHSICHWEIMWCYASQLNWPKAAHYSNLMRHSSKWSPSSYQYQYGTFLYAQLVEDTRNGLIDANSTLYKERESEIREIIERVPKLRIRYAGKTIPADKFAITRAEKFCNQNGRLSMPALEFLYIWNIFCTLKNSPKQVKAILDRLENEINFINSSSCARFSDQSNRDASSSDSQNALGDYGAMSSSLEHTTVKKQNDKVEDLCLMNLLKGICLKLLHRFEEAEACFMSVIEHEQEILIDKFLVPHSAMELALLNVQLKQYESAKHWIKQTRHNYTGYLMETIVHFRLHAASRVIRTEQRSDQLESSQASSVESNCSSPKSISRRTSKSET